MLALIRVFSPNRILTIKIAKEWCTTQAVKIHRRPNGGAYDDYHISTACCANLNFLGISDARCAKYDEVYNFHLLTYNLNLR